MVCFSFFCPKTWSGWCTWLEEVRFSLPRNGSEWLFESLFLFFVARKGLPSCVLFRGMVRNGIQRICICFGSTERNSELCSLPQNGMEQNYGSLLLFWFHGTEFRVISSSAEGFGTECRDFLFRGATGISSEITICSVYSVFHGIIFLSEIPNPSYTDEPLCLQHELSSSKKGPMARGWACQSANDLPGLQDVYFWHTGWASKTPGRASTIQGQPPWPLDHTQRFLHWKWRAGENPI